MEFNRLLRYTRNDGWQARNDKEASDGAKITNYQVQVNVGLGVKR
jgi:hypothetical protein